MSAPARRLSALLEQAGLAEAARTGPDPVLSGIEIDSRRIRPGRLFAALPGARQDGARFIPQAIAAGAVAVLAEGPRPAELQDEIAWVEVRDARTCAARLAREWHGRPDAMLTLVGVTGTNGKTTVCALVESIAREAGVAAGRIGTVGVSFAGRERPAARTTPEAVDLYEILAEMRDSGVELAAMEVSSHGLALRRVEGASFRVGALLNLGRDHLDFHPTEEDYRETKSRFIEELAADASAVLPADDRSIAAIGRRTRARVITFGRSADASVRLRDEQCGREGSTAILDTPGGSLPVRTRLAGRFNLDNVAAAAAIALAADLPIDAVPAGVLSLEGVPGRFESIDCGQPFSVIVDYAHTEAALARLLDGVREISGGRVVAVFGCGGGRDRGKRPGMGRAAAERADVLVLTSDNPRDEDPAAVLDEIRSGVLSVPGAGERCRVVPEREEAIGLALAEAHPGDAVVIAGKGHETGQEVRGTIRPLDDRETARRALSALGWAGGTCARA